MFIVYDTTTSSDATMQAATDIRSIANQNCFLAGVTAVIVDTKNLTEQEEPIYVGIAVALAFIVLMFAMGANSVIDQTQAALADNGTSPGLLSGAAGVAAGISDVLAKIVAPLQNLVAALSNDTASTDPDVIKNSLMLSLDALISGVQDLYSGAAELQAGTQSMSPDNDVWADEVKPLGLEGISCRIHLNGTTFHES